MIGSRRWLRPDPGLVQVRATVVTMAAVLASFGSALLVEGWAGLHADVVVLAVALAVTLGRQRGGDGLRHRLVGLVLLPVVAVIAAQVGLLMTRHAAIGDTLFAVAVSGSIWLRRFGPWPARLGTLAATPFLAMLISPVPLSREDARSLWTAVIGLIAIGWVALIRHGAERVGFLHSSAVPATAGGARRARPRRPGPGGLAASSRMAAQMGVALGAAFLAGHLVFGRHWPWVVITAFIVSSGNRGRGDVIYKAVLRLAGALGGTVAATLLAGAFPAGDRAGIVAIFVVLALGTWLRAFSYAYWAASVTAMLAFLYGFFGESGTDLLGDRLLCITVGAAIAVAAAWLVMPVRTTDVLRRRTADALAALSDFLGAARHDPDALAGHGARFAATAAHLEQIGTALRAHRLVTHRWRSGPHQADIVDGVRRCVAPVATLARLGAADPAILARAEYARRAGRHARTVGALRLALAGRPSDPTPRPPTPRPTHPAEPTPPTPPASRAEPTAPTPPAEPVRSSPAGPAAPAQNAPAREVTAAFAELGEVLDRLTVSIRAASPTRPGPSRAAAAPDREPLVDSV